MTKSATREAADKVTFTQAEVTSAITAGDTAARAGRKNLIINGGFDVWQRGTSFTTSAEYTADRWQLQLSGGTSTVTQQTFTVGQTEVPDNPTYYLKMNTTTGDNNCGMFHRVEDVRNGAGQNVTISFWAKGTNPAGGTFDLMSSQRFGAGGSSHVEITTPLTVTSSWAKYTHTFSLASISGKTMGTGSSLVLIIRQSAGDTSTTAWNLNIANVQLELGSVATDFEHRSYGEELALCQRYYEVIADGSVSQVQTFGIGHGYKSDQINWFYQFKVSKRTEAFTLEVVSTSTGYRARNNSTNKYSTTLGMSANLQSINQIEGYMTAISGITEQSCWSVLLNQPSSKIAVSAEL